MLRFGVIGTNWITESFIAAARESGEAAVTAVCSRTAERAEEFAAKHGIAHRYTEPEQLAASREIDAVYIASPNSYHARQAIACLERGKHVLCEKPIASNSDELEAMVAAARRSGVVLMEAVKSTLLPNFAAIRDNLPKLGPIRRYFASYGQYSSRYDAYKQGTVLNAFNPQFSNGALMDLGIYCIYPLAVLFGLPERIRANAWMLGSGVDGEGSLLLSYPDMEAVILYSKIANSALPSEIQGEHATMAIDRINELGKVEIRYRDGSVEDVSRPQPGHSMAYEVREFIAAVASGRTESETNSLASSLTAMRIMDEARRQIGLEFPADRSL
ncbi:oxidoreductase [Gordoniibacillus kamchatkensis]|uniref:Oxidoreductase n=1 Tax=Gordoniibacillus kamchatkensis TaxID=1590651 RepID=A0ABR5A3H7_9BACL|nr:Gfo/Idh/MocA family oxidoreductase [Paenibacillus sp. VKM B-2647]KIL35584.1 oxidoreductase [Paenibacillus sp. VKM B-2647]